MIDAFYYLALPQMEPAPLTPETLAFLTDN